MSLHISNHQSLNDTNSDKLKNQFRIADNLIKLFSISGEDYVRDYALLFCELWDMGLEGVKIEKILMDKCNLNQVGNSYKKRVHSILSN